jgi:polyphosphate:AMP phosphotransferase
MLADDGALILKFWFHLSKERQRKRLKALQSDPETRWRVTDRDWDFFKMYDRFYSVSEQALRETSTGWAPWIIVEGSDPEYRAVTVGRTLLDGMRERLKKKSIKLVHADAPPLAKPADKKLILDQLDQTQVLNKKRYESKLEKYQRDLSLLTRHPKFSQHSVIAGFEGMDAAGKGGAIRRVTAALDARLYRVIPVASPTDEERAQSHLWRFWRYLPMKGRYTLFDRTWYGRVLVERVEGFAGEADWMRAYGEINHFEGQLARAGAVVVKLWIAISAEEQLKRFQDREAKPFKRYKLTPEDWRNREKWPLYAEAMTDMVDRTSSRHAPWTLVEAEDKKFARLKVLRTIVDRLEQ